MTVVRDDSVSLILTGVGVLSIFYLVTFGLNVAIWPLMLMLLSGFLEWLFLKKGKPANSLVGKGSGGTRMKILYWTAIAVIGLTLTGITVSYVPGQVAGYVTFTFGVSMAIAEERIFRKFGVNYFVGKMGMSFGILASAVFFALYHLAVYGTQISALIYVLVGGTILGWVAVKSGRLSPVMVAHIINNVMASVG